MQNNTCASLRPPLSYIVWVDAPTGRARAMPDVFQLVIWILLLGGRTPLRMVDRLSIYGRGTPLAKGRAWTVSCDTCGMFSARLRSGRDANARPSSGRARATRATSRGVARRNPRRPGVFNPKMSAPADQCGHYASGGGERCRAACTALYLEIGEGGEILRWRRRASSVAPSGWLYLRRASSKAEAGRVGDSAGREHPSVGVTTLLPVVILLRTRRNVGPVGSLPADGGEPFRRGDFDG